MKEKILQLGNGECYIVPKSDYGKAEIWKINEIYFLFEIPTFGGLPKYEGGYLLTGIDDMIKIIESWT